MVRAWIVYHMTSLAINVSGYSLIGHKHRVRMVVNIEIL